MRHFINFSLLFFVAVFSQGCKEEDNNPRAGTGNIQFVFDQAGIDGLIQSENFPDGTHLIVSIQKSDGSAVLTRKEVTLVQDGDKFISDPVPLPAGSYELTDFWVVGSGRVMFAAPRTLSPLAELVNQPLPFSFVVTNPVLMKQVVQAIDVSASEPADFGYVSFGLDVIRRFGLSVFIPQDDGLALTTGEAFILHNNDTLHVHSLAAQINTIVFEEEPDDTFELVVIKDGYSRYARKFTFNQLKVELKRNPVIAVLAPALTLVADVRDYGVPPFFAINIGSYEGSLSIGWGDGSSEILSTPVSENVTHEYEKPGRYFVSVSGDLKKVYDIGLFYDDGRFTRIDLQHVTELTSFRAGYMGISPSVIDFTNNMKLEAFTLDYLPQLGEVIIPDGLKLRVASIGGLNMLTTQDVDGVIDVVYQSATHFNVQEGYFGIASVMQGEMTGPPSAASVAKLATLRDVYSWDVQPDF